jgi:hypothetical protein
MSTVSEIRCQRTESEPRLVKKPPFAGQTYGEKELIINPGLFYTNSYTNGALGARDGTFMDASPSRSTGATSSNFQRRIVMCMGSGPCSVSSRGIGPWPPSSGLRQKSVITEVDTKVGGILQEWRSAPSNAAPDNTPPQQLRSVRLLFIGLPEEIRRPKDR